MKSRFMNGFILSLLVVVLASCGQNRGASGPQRSLEGYPSRAGEVTPSGIHLGGVFRYNVSSEPRSLDPVNTGESSATAVVTQLYDGLINYDSNLNLIPGIAKEWEISEDGKTYTFHLREGVRFHDDPCFPNGEGREVTAHDVDFSLHRVVDPSTTSTGAWIFTDVVMGAEAFYSGEADRVSGFEVVDDYTFRITLNDVFAPFLYRLAMTYCYITAPEAVDHYGEDFFQNPVGTGPFDFVHWKSRQEILMVRHPNYWRTDEDGVQLPYLDAARMRFIADLKIEFLAFDRGNLDRLYSIHEHNWPTVMDENRELRPDYQKYQLLRKELLVTQYYGFNLEKEPFKDNAKLRQAFNYAIDREGIIEFVMNGRASVADSMVPHSMPGYESITEGYTRDLERAQQLLAEAGYPNGEGLPPITLDLNSGGTTNESIAEAIQAQLAEIGVEVQLNIVEWAQHLQNLDDGRPHFYRLGWIADYPDPENFLILGYSKNIPPVGANYSRFANEEFDRLFEEGQHTIDDEERTKLYQQAEKIFYEEAPWLFLVNTIRYSLVQPYVRNYVLNAQERPILHEVWFEMPQEEESEAAAYIG